MYIKVEETKKLFLDKISEGDRVLIIASHNVDAICALKIFQYIFQKEFIAYSSLFAPTIEDLIHGYNRVKFNFKFVLMLNCGSNFDIKYRLEPPPGQMFYILDSHRPIHILNIYDESRNILVYHTTDDIDIAPKFEDIFRCDDLLEDSDAESDNSNEDDEDMDEEDDVSDGRVREDAREKKIRKLEKRREKREMRKDWEDRRDELLYHYTLTTFYGPPSSLFAMDIANKVAKIDMQVMWWAIIGVCEQFVLGMTSREKYDFYVSQLIFYVNRIKNTEPPLKEAINVEVTKDIAIYLYRMWNIYDSLKTSPNSALKFKFWDDKGDTNYHHFIADLGLTIKDLRTDYSLLGYKIKQKFYSTALSPKSNNNLNDLKVDTFSSKFGHSKNYTAFDCYLIVLSILEHPHTSNNFYKAQDVLSRDKFYMFESYKKSGVQLLQIVFKTVNQAMKGDTFMKYISFFVCTVPDSCDYIYFESPGCLHLLSNFLIKAYIEKFKDHSDAYRFSSGSRNTIDNTLGSLPLIIFVPCKNGKLVVFGVPPVQSNSTNILGKVFEEVGRRMGDGIIKTNSFDSSIIEIDATNKIRFLEYLSTLLKTSD